MDAASIAAAEERIRNSRMAFNAVRQQGFTPTPIKKRTRSSGVSGRFYLHSSPVISKSKGKTDQGSKPKNEGGSSSGNASSGSSVTVIRLTLRMSNNLNDVNIFDDVTVGDDGSLAFKVHGSEKTTTTDINLLNEYNEYKIPLVIQPFSLFEVAVFAYSPNDIARLIKIPPGPIDISFWGSKSIYTNKETGVSSIMTGFNGDMESVKQYFSPSHWANYVFHSELARQPVNSPIRRIPHQECMSAASNKYFTCPETQSYVIHKHQAFKNMSNEEIVMYLRDKPVGFITVEDAVLTTDEKGSIIKVVNKVSYIDLRMSMILSCQQSNGDFTPVESTIQLWATDLCNKVDFFCLYFTEGSKPPLAVSDNMLQEFSLFLLRLFKYIDWVLLCQDSAKEAGRITSFQDDGEQDKFVEFTTAFEKPILYMDLPSYVMNNGFKINQDVAENLIQRNVSSDDQYIIIYQPTSEEQSKIKYAAKEDPKAPLVNYGYMPADMRREYVKNNPEISFYFLPFKHGVGKILQRLWNECEHDDMLKFMTGYADNWQLGIFGCKDVHAFIYCVNEGRIKADEEKMRHFNDFFFGNNEEADSPQSKRIKIEN